MKTNFNETKHFALTATYICHFCVQQNEYSLRRFSVPRILRCPAIIIFFRRLLVISGFGRNLGLTHLALMSYFYGSDARQDELRLSQTALLWISKVWGYDHVCSWCSAKKTRKSQINQTHFIAGQHWSKKAGNWTPTCIAAAYRQLPSLSIKGKITERWFAETASIFS